MGNKVIFACGLLLLAAGTDVGGVIAQDTHWSGTVVIVEDVIVPRGVTLTIDPGTRIIPAPDVKGGGKGWVPRSLEIHVHGSLLARGTPSRRIRFGPEGAKPDAPPAWFGMVFHPGRGETSRLYWCAVEGATAGVQVAGREVELIDCLFAGCTVGLSAGVLRGNGGVARITKVTGAAPIARACLFARCETGVVSEADARPDLERCVFLDCKTGLGYRGIARYSRPVRGVGSRLERCEFVRCNRAVAAGARISNCIFDHNTAAIVSSTAHATHGITIDRYRIEGVLADGNTKLLVGDLPPVVGLRKAAVGRRGELPRWKRYQPMELWGEPLKKLLGLVDGSAGRGLATDGGDVGAFGRGRQKSAVAYGSQRKITGLLLDSWLLCGPIGWAGALDPEWPGRKTRLGLAGKNFVWVGVADAESQPRRPGGSLTAGPNKPRFVAAELKSKSEARLRLGIAFDGSASVWCNGRQLLKQTTIHFAEENFVQLDLEKGSNRLVLLLTPRMEQAPFRARVVQNEADTPPGVSCVSQQKKSRRFAVRSAKPEKLDDGRYKLVVRFSAPPFWSDATGLKNYSLTTMAGVPHKLRCRRVEYLPKRAEVILYGVTPPYLESFLLVIAPMRDVSGIRRAPSKPIKVTFK